MQHPAREQETIDELRRWIRLAQQAEWWAQRGLCGTRWIGARVAVQIRRRLLMRVIRLLHRRGEWMKLNLKTGRVSLADAMRHWFSASMLATVGAATGSVGPLEILDEVVAFTRIEPADAPRWGTTPEVFASLDRLTGDPLTPTGS